MACRHLLPPILILTVIAAAWFGTAFSKQAGLSSTTCLNVYWTVASLWAAVTCFLRAKSIEEPSLRKAWKMFGIGCASWFSGQLLWDYQEIIAGHPIPFAGWQDAGYIAAGPFFLAGFYFFSDSNRAPVTVTRKLCNFAILCCATVTIVILLCGTPFLANGNRTAFLITVFGWGVLMPSAFLGGLLCYWLYASGNYVRQIGLLVAGVGAMAVESVQYSIETAANTYRPGNLGDYLCLGAFGLIVWAAREPLPKAATNASSTRKIPCSFMEPALPAICILAVLVVVLWKRDEIGPLIPLTAPVFALLAISIGVRDSWSAHIETQLFEKLRTSERTFRHVVDSNMIGIVFADCAGRIVDANDAFLKIIGYTREELEAGLLDWRKLTPPEHMERGAAAAENVKVQGIITPYEKEYLHKDGRRIPVLLGAALLPETKDRVVAFVVDLTERKSAEHALEETRARLQAALDHLPFTFWSMDQSRRYTYQNAVSLVTWGDQRGKRLEEVTHTPGLLEERQESYQRAFAGEIVRAEVTQGEGAEMRCYQRIIVPIHQNGEITGIFGVNIDRTNEKRVQRALECSERRFRALVENSSDGIAAWDADGRIQYATPSNLRVLGWSPDEVLGLSVHDFFHPEDLSMMIAARRTAVETAQIQTSLRARVRHKNGSWRQCEGVLTNLLDDPAVGALVVNYHDITEREQSERALRESEARLQAFMDNSLSQMFIKDRQGRYLHGNKKWLEARGSVLQDAIGRTDWELFPPEQARAFTVNDEQTIAAGKPLQFEEIVMTDGREHACLVQKFPLRNAAGEINAIGGIATDITERVRAENALRLSEERFRSLVNGARDAIFTLSPEGILTSANPGAEMLTGIPNSERMNQDFLPLVAPGDRPRALELFQRVLTGVKMEAFELVVLGAGNRRLLMEFTVTPQYDGDKIIGVLGIGRDITERRALEQQLLQSQKMESIGQLAGGIAHDFNNLLTVIQGNTSLIECEGDLPPSIVNSVQEISTAADRAASLTRQLLAFSRRQLIQPRDLDVNEIISDLAKILRRLLGEDITLQFESSNNLPQIHADAGMIEQILLNLAVNARDAMPHGGRLTIRTKHVQIHEDAARKDTEARAGNFVRISVTDTGCGIAPEHIPHIFEPFFTTKDVGKGTGLGLATVYGIVKQHQGWVNMHSAVGRGTRFDIFLPAQARTMEPAPQKPALASAMPRGNETILIVEDEEPLRAMVKVVLSRLGYRVLEARSGAEALKMWPEYRDTVDLVFTDMVMPDGVSGQQLVEQLQKDRTGLRVLFTSGYSAQMLARNGRLPTGAHCLQKPYLPPALANAVRAALGGD